MTARVAPPLELGRDDTVAGRDFADPEQIAGDRSVLDLLAADFHDHATDAGASIAPMIRHVPGPDQWHRRVVIPQPGLLWQHDRITVVGFLGRVREVVDHAVAKRIKELSDRLVDAVLVTTGVLGYSTHLLADERNYANLVLVASPDVIDRWRTAPPHPAAVEISPRYYQYVRIYRGTASPVALARPGAVSLSLVKYWDYRSDPIWHAIRTLG